jgi:hypothetical protein
MERHRHSLEELPHGWAALERESAVAKAADPHHGGRRHGRSRQPVHSTISMRPVRCARARGIWLHIDGAHGATARCYRTAASMRGMDRARSIAWDPHKMMLLPLPAGCRWFVRASCRRCSRNGRRIYSTVTTTRRAFGIRAFGFQCSRRADVLCYGWCPASRSSGDRGSPRSPV